jgi:AbrB family looped-hinge helix DNA binding protein
LYHGRLYAAAFATLFVVKLYLCYDSENLKISKLETRRHSIMRDLLDKPAEKFIVQVRARGQLTIPQLVRQSLSIREGDALTLVQVGDSILLSPRELQGPELGDRFTALMQEAGVTLADLLEELPEIRRELHEERVKSGAA